MRANDPPKDSKSSKKIEYFSMAKGLMKQAGYQTIKRNSKPLVFNLETSKNNSLDSLDGSSLFDPISVRIRYFLAVPIGYVKKQ